MPATDVEASSGSRPAPASTSATSSATATTWRTRLMTVTQPKRRSPCSEAVSRFATAVKTMPTPATSVPRTRVES